MTASLWDLVPSNTKRISIVGLAKNVGKTTALNWLTEEAFQREHTLGLASIGVDGETVDVWDGHTKPAIHIREGMWAATAQAALSESTASFRYVEELKSSSPLGPVFLVQCTKNGTIKLGGTHTLQDLEQVHQAFLQYGVSFTLIDGAYDRLAAAQHKVAEGFILCTGSALDTDLGQAKTKTAEVLNRWLLPEWSDSWPDSLQGVAYKPDQQWKTAEAGHALQSFDKLRLLVAEGIEALWIPGALTEQMLQQFVTAKQPFAIILDNPTKCFASHTTLLRWLRKGGTVYVRSKSKLLALVVNPFSPQREQDARLWLAEMKCIAGDIPVIDAKRRVIL